jgi:5-hydroxyisourate hydrolase
MTTLSTHVLDTARGRPAAGVRVVLDAREDGGHWRRLGEATTDSDGRARDMGEPRRGVHRLTFDTGSWFAAQGVEGFYPEAVVVFEVRDDGHHHVPLLLSPFGYSTYRGS